MDFHNLNETDPLKRMVEKETGAEELSPMDPPDAFSPPAMDTVPFEQLHPFLQEFMNEHKSFSNELNNIEILIHTIQKEGFNKKDNDAFAVFFRMLDEEVLRHHKAEEMLLFPVLQKRLLENDEHSKGRYPKTAIDMMMDDHIKITQLSALAFNMMSLAFRLPDKQSGLMVLDLAIEQCKMLHETLKLHIFREDNIIWPLAHKYITKAEFDDMLARKILAEEGEKS